MKKHKLLIMTLLTSLLLGVILSFSGCEKIDVPAGTPNCIKREIRKIKNHSKRNPPAKVWRYTYNGGKVYYIPPYCCDVMGELYDEKCNIICHPDGGFTGNGDGKCSDFFQKRTDEELIWEDNR